MGISPEELLERGYDEHELKTEGLFARDDLERAVKVKEERSKAKEKR